MIIDFILNKLGKYLSDLSKVNEVSASEINKEPVQIKIAKLYLNKSEKTDTAELKELLGINPATTPWCAAFVNAVEKMCGRKGTGKMLARSFLNYGTAVGVPQVGDIVVFKRGNSSWQGHVGYYVSSDKEFVTSLGGNQGDKVCYAKYPRTSVLGFRRP